MTDSTEKTGAPETGSEQAGELDATRRIDLSGVLGGLLGETEPAAPAAPRPEGGADLGSILMGLLGDRLNVGGLAKETGLSQSVIQAAVPLLLGALLQGSQQKAAAGAAEAPRASLADLAGRVLSGKAVGPKYLAETGLPDQLTRATGLDAKTALEAIMAILKALGKGTTAAKPKAKPKSKPKKKKATSSASKPKPKTTAKSKPKPKTSAKSKPKPKTTAKSKPKPKSSAKPKTTAKPKSTSTTKPKPKTTAKPKRKTTSSTKPKPKTTAKPKPKTTSSTKPKPKTSTSKKTK